VALHYSSEFDFFLRIAAATSVSLAERSNEMFSAAM